MQSTQPTSMDTESVIIPLNTTLDTTPPPNNDPTMPRTAQPTATLTFSTVIRFLLVCSIVSPLILSIIPLVSLDTCHIDRKQHKYQSFYYATPLMLVCLVVLLLMKLYGTGTHLHSNYIRLRAKKRSYRWHYAGLILLSYVHYFSAYFLCNALKAYLSDTQCNVHSNSVSGHYLFFIYVSMALLHQHIHQLGCMHMSLFNIQTYYKLFLSDIQNILFTVFYMGFVILSSLILYDTYMGGYHTIRQILYGIALAFIYQQVLVDTVEFIDMCDQPSYNIQLVQHSTDTLQQRREVKHINTINNSDESESTLNHTDINPQQHKCLVHTSSHTFKSYLQHILYYMALWPIQRHNNNNVRICGSYLSYRIWSVVLLTVAVSTLMSYMLLQMSREPDNYSVADIIMCIITWCVLVILHATHRLTTSDTCNVHTHNSSVVHNNNTYDSVTNNKVPHTVVN